MFDPNVMLTCDPRSALGAEAGSDLRSGTSATVAAVIVDFRRRFLGSGSGARGEEGPIGGVGLGLGVFGV